MITNPNRKRTIRIASRVSIGLATVAIAATTFGAASASAATVSHRAGNSVSIGTVVHASTQAKALMPGAFAPGGKGSPSEKTCDYYDAKIKDDEKHFWQARVIGQNGDRQEKDENRHIAQAENAGCVVIFPTAT